MPPLVVAAAVAAGGAVAAGIAKKKAIKRAKEAADKKASAAQKEIDDAVKFKEDNKYEVPDIIKDRVALAKQEVGNSTVQTNLERMANDKLARNVGNIQRTATSSTDALGALAHAENQASQDFTQAAVAGGQERQQDLQNLYGAQSELGSYENIQYDQNINMPYLQRMELAQGKLGLATQMQMQAGGAKLENAGFVGRGIAAGATAYMGGGTMPTSWKKNS